MNNLQNIIKDVTNFKKKFNSGLTFFGKYKKINTSILQDNYINITIFKSDGGLYEIKNTVYCGRNWQSQKTFDEIINIIKEQVL